MGFSAAKPFRIAGVASSHRVGPQWIATRTSLTRNVWQCARNGQGEKAERTSQRMERRPRYPAFNTTATGGRPDGSATPNQSRPSWSWGVWYSPKFTDFWTGQERRIWDVLESHKRMESLRKAIEADPYSALFGRRWNPSHKSASTNVSWNGFLQSNPGTHRPIKTNRTSPAQRRTEKNDNHIGLQYDPISGRMAPKGGPPTPSQSLHEKAKPTYSSKLKKDHTDLSSSGFIDDAGHQAATSDNDKTHCTPQSALGCSPGRDSDTLPRLNSSSPNTQAGVQTPEETVVRSSVNPNCSPGNELESFLASESTEPTQHQSEGLEADKNIDIGERTSGSNVECSPGKELEVKFIADPASCSDESSPSVLNSQEQHEMPSVNLPCSPGSELGTKFTAEHTHSSMPVDDAVQPEVSPEARSSSQESIVNSPGSERTEELLAGSTSGDDGQSEVKTPVDCSPGNELEAKFSLDPASVEDGQPQAAMKFSTSNNANINIDCPPGSELEAMFVAGSTSTKDANANKDLDSFDASEDRVGDYIINKQEPALEHEAESTFSHQPLPEFHILTFDVTTSQVVSTGADSFFGINEDTRPIDILSRLHNPTKFIPYFDKMQKNGYKITTGGGEILVFQKINNTTQSPKIADQEPTIPVEIAKDLRLDPMRFTPSYQGIPGQSTAKLHATTESSNHDPKPFTKSRTPFGGAIHRMLFAGAATAATCYAIGVVTEFFRTGGKDGRGVDAFTVFESDRRRRE